jgi:hypothetical protein
VSFKNKDEQTSFILSREILYFFSFFLFLGIHTNTLITRFHKELQKSIRLFLTLFSLRKKLKFLSSKSQ